MENNNFKIVYKKPIDYENSTQSNSSMNSNSSQDNNSLSSSNIYINFDSNKSKIFDSLSNQVNTDIILDINFIINNIFKLNDKEEIKKEIINYLNSKNYSEQKQNQILLELKNYTSNQKLNSTQNQQQNNNIPIITNPIQQINNQYDKPEVINDTTEKNKCFLIITIVLVIIIFVTLYIKLSSDDEIEN